MGYTHYWRADDDTALASVFPQLVLDAQRIVQEAAKREILIAGPHGDGLPLFSADLIALNGDESVGGDYETFMLQPSAKAFDFCKTAYRPYDAVVTAILLRIHSLAPTALDISSDGWQEDWEPGVALYVATFGEQPSFPADIVRQASNA